MSGADEFNCHSGVTSTSTSTVPSVDALDITSGLTAISSAAASRAPFWFSSLSSFSPVSPSSLPPISSPSDSSFTFTNTVNNTTTNSNGSNNNNADGIVERSEISFSSAPFGNGFCNEGSDGSMMITSSSSSTQSDSGAVPSVFSSSFSSSASTVSSESPSPSPFSAPSQFSSSSLSAFSISSTSWNFPLSSTPTSESVENIDPLVFASTFDFGSQNNKPASYTDSSSASISASASVSASSLSFLSSFSSLSLSSTSSSTASSDAFSFQFFSRALGALDKTSGSDSTTISSERRPNSPAASRAPFTFSVGSFPSFSSSSSLSPSILPPFSFSSSSSFSFSSTSDSSFTFMNSALWPTTRALQLTSPSSSRVTHHESVMIVRSPLLALSSDILIEILSFCEMKALNAVRCCNSTCESLILRHPRMWLGASMQYFSITEQQDTQLGTIPPSRVSLDPLCVFGCVQFNAQSPNLSKSVRQVYIHLSQLKLLSALSLRIRVDDFFLDAEIDVKQLAGWLSYNMPHLTALRVRVCGETSTTMLLQLRTMLTKLTKLTSLSLRVENVENWFTVLPAEFVFPLRSLQLAGSTYPATSIGDQFARLSSQFFPHLTTLMLENVQLSPQQFRALFHPNSFPNLYKLSLLSFSLVNNPATVVTKVEEDVSTQFINHTLHELLIDNHDIPHLLLFDVLSACKNLKVLKCDTEKYTRDGVSDELWSLLKLRTPQISHVELLRYSSTNSEPAQLPQLQQLRLLANHVQKFASYPPWPISSMFPFPNLTTLCFDKNLTDELCASLAATCRCLTSLYFEGSSELTLDGIKLLGSITSLVDFGLEPLVVTPVSKESLPPSIFASVPRAALIYLLSLPHVRTLFKLYDENEYWCRNDKSGAELPRIYGEGRKYMLQHQLMSDSPVASMTPLQKRQASYHFLHHPSVPQSYPFDPVTPSLVYPAMPDVESKPHYATLQMLSFGRGYLTIYEVWMLAAVHPFLAHKITTEVVGLPMVVAQKQSNSSCIKLHCENDRSNLDCRQFRWLYRNLRWRRICTVLSMEVRLTASSSFFEPVWKYIVAAYGCHLTAMLLHAYSLSASLFSLSMPQPFSKLETLILIDDAIYALFDGFWTASHGTTSSSLSTTSSSLSCELSTLPLPALRSLELRWRTWSFRPKASIPAEYLQNLQPVTSSLTHLGLIDHPFTTEQLSVLLHPDMVPHLISLDLFPRRSISDSDFTRELSVFDKCVRPLLCRSNSSQSPLRHLSFVNDVTFHGDEFVNLLRLGSNLTYLDLTDSFHSLRNTLPSLMEEKPASISRCPSVATLRISQRDLRLGQSNSSLHQLIKCILPLFPNVSTLWLPPVVDDELCLMISSCYPKLTSLHFTCSAEFPLTLLGLQSLGELKSLVRYDFEESDLMKVFTIDMWNYILSLSHVRAMFGSKTDFLWPPSVLYYVDNQRVDIAELAVQVPASAFSTRAYLIRQKIIDENTGEFVTNGRSAMWKQIEKH